MSEFADFRASRDRSLAARMQRGDERAIAEFCAENLPKLFRYAMRRLRNEQDVDEVVQTVLSIAARRIETYRGEATLFTWLVRICRHEIARHIDAAGRHDAMRPFMNDDVLRAVVESLEAPETEEPEASARRGELIELVQSALDQLPTRYADVLELRYVLGFSSKEIAQRLNVGDEAAQSLLGRARRAFREVCSEAVFAELRTDGSP